MVIFEWPFYTGFTVKEMFSSQGSPLTIAMFHHGETIKLTHYDETKKRAHDSQIVRAKNLVESW